MEIKNLHFSFKNQQEHPLFRNLNLKIAPEKITILLGQSGCGKSTLLRIFAGLIPVKSNSFLHESKTESFVFQEANLLPWLTCKKNIMLPLELANNTHDVEYFSEIVKLLKIEDCLSKYPSQLSGGQRMRVSIARALITKPEILFMDEPFSSLDEPTRLKLQDELLAIQKKLRMTVLFVTHSFYEAAYLGDRILIFSSKDSSDSSAISYDQENLKKFSSRYDREYQLKVQEISQAFEKEAAI